MDGAEAIHCRTEGQLLPLTRPHAHWAADGHRTAGDGATPPPLTLRSVTEATRFALMLRSTVALFRGNLLPGSQPEEGGVGVDLNTRCVETEKCATRRVSIEEAVEIERTSGQCLVSYHRKLQVEDRRTAIAPKRDAPVTSPKGSWMRLLLRAIVRFMISLAVEE
jgi:hypothetical protein